MYIILVSWYNDAWCWCEVIYTCNPVQSMLWDASDTRAEDSRKNPWILVTQEVHGWLAHYQLLLCHLSSNNATASCSTYCTKRDLWSLDCLCADNFAGEITQRVHPIRPGSVRGDVAWARTMPRHCPLVTYEFAPSHEEPYPTTADTKPAYCSDHQLPLVTWSALQLQYPPLHDKLVVLSVIYWSVDT